MRIKFLVVLAVICLCAHYASASGMGGSDKGKKDAAPKPEPKPAKPESSEYEIEVIKHNKEKTEKKEKEKKTRVVTRKITKMKENFKTCEETLKEEKADCEKGATAGYKAVFGFTDIGKECEWTCDYEALPTPPPQKKKVKVIKPPKEKTPKKPKKECSGEKVIKFQNCLVKVRGLIAFGDKTRNFDKKFAKLVQAKAKKGAKKAKGGKKGGKKGPKPAPAGPK